MRNFGFGRMIFMFVAWNIHHLRIETNHKTQIFSKNIENFQNQKKLYVRKYYVTMRFQGIFLTLPELGGDACTKSLNEIFLPWFGLFYKPFFRIWWKIISKPRIFSVSRVTLVVCRITVRSPMDPYGGSNQSTRSNSFISGRYDDPEHAYDHLRVPWTRPKWANFAQNPYA